MTQYALNHPYIFAGIVCFALWLTAIVIIDIVNTKPHGEDRP